MMSYPIESEKGVAIGIFWSIFNTGGVVGAAVSLAENFHSEKNSGTLFKDAPPAGTKYLQ